MVILGIIIVVIVVLILRLIFNKPKSKPNYTPKGAILNPVQIEFLSLLNAHRNNLSLTSLQAESKCNEVALDRITQINSDNFSHAYFTLYQKYLEELGFKSVGELLSKEHNTISSTFNHYLRSKKHREYLQQKDLKYIGVGIIVNSKGNYNSCIILTK
jgi:uncharacterized protein YkwD